MILTGYVSKQKLYKYVNMKLKELNITEKDYPLNSLNIARLYSDNLIVDIIEFPSSNIGGLLYKDDTLSSIALNSLRSEKGRNFDCMHELMHYWFHPSGQKLCVDNTFISQNKSIEWQANEGAAQILMPEKLFREKYLLFSGDIKALSDYFLVGEQSIKYRIDNLKLSKIEKVNIANKPIIINSKGTYRKRHCSVCGNSELNAHDNYCKICGNDMFCFVTGSNWTTYDTILNMQNICSESSCSSELDSNARFCSKCGSFSTAFLHNHLNDWKDESLNQVVHNTFTHK